jgi:hypothetical protein
MDNRSLMVCTPCFGGLLTLPFVSSLLRLQDAVKSHGIGFKFAPWSGDALVTRARNELVASFLDSSATHLLFIDADIGFESQQVFRLLDFGADVTAAAYPLKYIDWDKIKRAVDAGRPDLETAAMNYVLPWRDSKSISARNGFISVRHVGTGFLMISRAALVRLCKAHPELQYAMIDSVTDPQPGTLNRFALFDPMIEPEARISLSEDYAFCRRWTDLGGEIWLDTQSKLTHTGPITFAGNLATQFR